MKKRKIKKWKSFNPVGYGRYPGYVKYNVMERHNFPKTLFRRNKNAYYGNPKNDFRSKFRIRSHHPSNVKVNMGVDLIWKSK